MNAPSNVHSFLRRLELFDDLSEEELSLVANLLTPAHFSKDEIIFHQGEEGKKIYIILQGEVEIYKVIDAKEDPFSLAILQQGQWFGEMAFLDDLKRSASAKALTETELLVLELSNFGLLKEKITTNLGKKVSQRLREIGEDAIKQEALRTLELHQMEKFLIHLFILISLFFYAFKITTLVSDPTLILILPSIFIICLGFSAALLVMQSHQPLEFFGLTCKNGKRNALEAILFSLPLLAIMILIKWILIKTVPALHHLSLFTFHQNTTIFALIYMLLVPIQEFITRGCLQSLLQHFFRSKNKIWLAIISSNLLFGMFHGFKTFTFITGAFILGNFWGWLYARQKSILGPCVSHALIGGLCFSVLDYMSILVYG